MSVFRVRSVLSSCRQGVPIVNSGINLYSLLINQKNLLKYASNVHPTVCKLLSSFHSHRDQLPTNSIKKMNIVLLSFRNCCAREKRKVVKKGGWWFPV